MSADLLLTGATGFVGMEVLGRYLERSDRHIITPVRTRCCMGCSASAPGATRTEWRPSRLT